MMTRLALLLLFLTSAAYAAPEPASCHVTETQLRAMSISDLLQLRKLALRASDTIANLNARRRMGETVPSNPPCMEELSSLELLIDRELKYR